MLDRSGSRARGLCGLGSCDERQAQAVRSTRPRCRGGPAVGHGKRCSGEPPTPGERQRDPESLGTRRGGGPGSLVRHCRDC
ncbi:hypothetical protein NDU88_008219 [Pleurodeles waltl]|uniref:Uncharacterized protein n=1 Tax=Pleurodeles waltl TaxID=8319 RepID=A0AAV7VUI2_PLEWA|nr:hypothetical protein NDU88_008219 [Pleurodeles waltl]